MLLLVGSGTRCGLSLAVFCNSCGGVIALRGFLIAFVGVLCKSQFDRLAAAQRSLSAQITPEQPENGRLTSVKACGLRSVWLLSGGVGQTCSK